MHLQGISTFISDDFLKMFVKKELQCISYWIKLFVNDMKGLYDIRWYNFDKGNHLFITYHAFILYYTINNVRISALHVSVK
jgi:hypothetical protein